MAMEIEKIAPELRKPSRKMSLMPMPLSSRWGRGLLRWAIAHAATPAVEGVTVERRAAPRVHIFRPDRPACRGALLWMHGGGYLIGHPAQDHALCGDMARRLGMLVVAVEYRLAPEHGFPAPLDDCHAAWRWLVDNAGGLGIDPESIVIGGQSAGGGLAASLVQRVADAGGIQPAGQLLMCPMLDDRTAADASLDAIGHIFWNNRRNRIGWRAYLGRDPGAPDLPPYMAAARRAELSGLPPAWIGVGTVDLFHAEDRAYAERLRAAGVDTHFLEIEGAPHGFEAWASDSPQAQAYLADARQWLAGLLGCAT